MDKMNKTMSAVDMGDREIKQLRSEMEIQRMYNNICNIAEKHNVDVTDKAMKIARARVLTDCPLYLCVCARDDTERGCISPKCMKEIEEKGMCHCQCYRRR